MISFFNLFKPENLVKQVVPQSKTDTKEGIINWQTSQSRHNNFPQQLLQNTQDSPAGSSAIDQWAKFIEGDGLLNEAEGDTVINKNQTVNDLNKLLATDLANLYGCAFIVRYAPNGTRTEIHHVPFEEARLGIPDGKQIRKLYHNPYYGILKDFDHKNTVWYYDYNPEGVREEILRHNKEHTKDGKITLDYPGQMFWHSVETPLARVYPKPFYYSTVNWFEIDAGIQNFHERNLDNNMLLSVLINMHGDPSDPAGPPSDSKNTTNKTEDQELTKDDVMKANLKEFQVQKGGALINWFLKEEEKATFEQFPTNSHHDLFTALQALCSDQIAIGTQTPRILINIATTGKLGDSQEVLNSWELMNSNTESLRNVLTRIYKKVFGFESGEIKTRKPPAIVPEQIWSVLTTDEKRIHAAKHFDVELNEEVTELEEETPEIQTAVENLIKQSNGS